MSAVLQRTGPAGEASAVAGRPFRRQEFKCIHISDMFTEDAVAASRQVGRVSAAPTLTALGTSTVSKFSRRLKHLRGVCLSAAILRSSKRELQLAGALRHFRPPSDDRLQHWY